MAQALAAAAAEETPPTDRQGLLRLAQRLLSALPHARGDLDARVGRVNRWQTFCGYLAGYVVDGLFGIITAVVFAVGNAWQAALLSPALAQHQLHIPGQAQDITIDSAFDYPDVHQAITAAKLKGYVASRDHRGPKGRCCGCADCPLRAQCVGEDTAKPRTITLRPAEHRQWLANRAANQTEEYKQAQKQRLVWGNVFGHGNTYHHGDKAPYRGQPMNEIAEVMTVTAINLEKMVRYGNRRQLLQARTPA